jgi:phage-related protein (TIGR01555 family)
MYRDGVIEAMQAAAGGRFGQFGYMSQVFAPQIAAAAYLTSGMLQKVIELPASDRVREWRDWQADKEQIEALEAEERRLGIRAKVKEVEILRGLGGGALVLAAPGSPETPIGQVGKGQLAAVNVVGRDQIELVDIDLEITSPTYRQPKFFRVRTTNGQSPAIHPSRVICFKGAPMPPGFGVSDHDLFWGHSQLMRVYREVEKADNAQAWFAALVKKAKLLRIGIPGLTDMVATEGGEARLTRRMSAIATGESSLNAVVYEAANADGKGGEELTDYQITWAGIPAMMDAFDQRVAAVSNIPFTVLMGRSPAGMNATGDHDRDNWHREVAAGQTLELQPCLDQLDAALIPSALGSRPADLWWQFAPLDSPTEKEESETFKTTMDAVNVLASTGTIPDIALSKGVQNLMTERGWMPGLDQALAEVPEAERFPEGPTEEEMRAENEAEAKANAAPNGNQPPARRAVNDAWFFADAKAKPLYVQRKLLNAADLIAWAKAQGFKSTLPAGDMHVTVLYSRTAVDPMKMGETWSGDEKGNLIVKPGGPRAVEKLGENAVVLLFASSELVWRHKSMVEAGASHDWDEYQPHVTISYEVPGGVDLEQIKPFTGELRFGPEIFEPLDLDWKAKVSEE